MKRFLLILAVSTIYHSTPSMAQTSRELLLFQEIPTVFTVSKKEQLITDSPSAVSIITDEEIRASGATNIPDLLRMVPGVDVMAISATDINVNLRGFNKESSHKLLVLIDGRSVYLDFMGIVLWESLPITMEEIKRIEVVKGPGSAIWGANAYSGIINIVTKRPEEMRGTTVSATYGEQDTLIGSIIHAGREGKTSYKVAAGWKQTDHWGENNWGPAAVRDEDDRALEAKKANFMVDHQLAGNAGLTLSGGIDDSNGDTLTALDVYERENRASFLKLDYKRGSLSFHTYWNSLRADIGANLAGDGFAIDTDTYDFELQKIIDTGPRNSIIAGASYRINTLDSKITAGYHHQELWGLYLQDDFRPVEGLLFTVGARHDHHPLVGENLSPRAAVIYKPGERHSLRLSYTTSFSLPTFTQSYLSKDYVLNGIQITGKGNRDVGPEKMRSWDAGYQGQITERVKGSLDLFHNELENFITFVPSGGFTEYTYGNIGKYKASGGEASIEFYIARDLTARANYSYQYIWNEEADTRVRYSPLSKINAELRYDPGRGLNTAIWINNVGGTNWTSKAPSENWNYPVSLTTRPGTDPEVGSYTLLNMKIGYRFTEDTELSISAFNMLNDRHREFIAGDEIGRRISANITARF